MRARRDAPGRKLWRAAWPLQWTGVAFASSPECPMIDYFIPAITWSVTITDAGNGGTQALSGIVASGTDGFFNTGSITVTPAGGG